MIYLIYKPRRKSVPKLALIRADFAESIAANAVHGSDSDENAAIEGAFFFSQRDMA